MRVLTARHPWFVAPGFGAAPVGAVLAFAGTLGAADSSPPGTSSAPVVGTTAPIEAWGWMACDGRELAIGHYPELFAVLGYVYGGSGSSFNLPDYRGYFLRGMGGNTTIDPDQNARTAATNGEPTGIGSTQQSAIWSHTHQFPQSTPSGVTNPGSDSGVVTPQNALTTPPLTDSGTDPGASVSNNETRPINIYVNYIIKFTGVLRPWGAPGTRRLENEL